MSLGIPGQIIQIRDNVAVVDFWGTRKSVKLDTLEEQVVAGDYIINYAGYAIRRIPPADVVGTLAMYEIVLGEAGEDPIVIEVLEELDEANDLALV